MNRRQAGQHASDRGAVAVEFALLLPLLLLIVFGVIDFGRALNAQITLTQAAREGARLAAVGYANTDVQTRTVSAATGLGLQPANVTVTDYPGNSTYACPAGIPIGTTNAQVQVSYSFTFATPLGAIMRMIGGSGFGSGLSLSATGVMPCET